MSSTDATSAGVITTHCVSNVIHPGRNKSRDPLQFVKIQTPDLSKKAVEQIRLAEEVKITKEKIKEVEEEWQSNLLNWKSKRRQTSSTGKLGDEDDEANNASNCDRKVKTFSEILNEKAKSGHRIGYNLHRYLADGNEDDLDLSQLLSSCSSPSSSSENKHSNEQREQASTDADKDLLKEGDGDGSTGSKCPLTSSSTSFDHSNSVSQLNYNNHNNNNHHMNNNNNNNQAISYNGKGNNYYSNENRTNSPTATAACASSTGATSTATELTATVATTSTSTTATSVNSMTHHSQQQQQQQQHKQQQPNVVVSSTCSSSCSSHSDQCRKVNKNSSHVTGNSDNDTANNLPHHRSLMDEKTKNVWNYLLQQPDTPRRIHREDITDEEDDDEFSSSHSGIAENDEDDAQRIQQLNDFKAKVFAFETLAKGEIGQCNSSTASTSSMTISANKSASSTSSSSSTISSTGGPNNQISSFTSKVKGTSNSGSAFGRISSSSSSHHPNSNHQRLQEGTSLMEKESKFNGERVTSFQQASSSSPSSSSSPASSNCITNSTAKLQHGSNNKFTTVAPATTACAPALPRTGHSPNSNDESTGGCNSSSMTNLVSNLTHSGTSASSNSKFIPDGRSILNDSSCISTLEPSYGNTNGINDSRHLQQQQQQQQLQMSNLNYNCKSALPSAGAAAASCGLAAGVGGGGGGGSSSLAYHSKDPSYTNGSLAVDINACTIDQMTGHFSTATTLEPSGEFLNSQQQHHHQSTSQIHHSLSHLKPQFTSSSTSTTCAGVNLNSSIVTSLRGSTINTNNGSVSSESSISSSSCTSLGQTNGHIGHISPDLIHSGVPFGHTLTTASSNIHHQRDFSSCSSLSNSTNGPPSVNYAPLVSSSAVQVNCNSLTHQQQQQVPYPNHNQVSMHPNKQQQQVQQQQPSMAHLVTSSQQHQQQLYYDTQNQYANQQLVNEQLAALAAAAAAAQHQSASASNVSAHSVASSSTSSSSSNVNLPANAPGSGSVTHYHKSSYLTSPPPPTSGHQVNYDESHVSGLTRGAVLNGSASVNGGSTGPSSVMQEPLYSNQQPVYLNQQAIVAAQQQFNHPVYYPKPYNASPSTTGIPPKKPLHTLITANSTTTASAVTTPAVSSMTSSSSLVPGYNQSHWVIQEAELRRQLASGQNASGTSGVKLPSSHGHSNLLVSSPASSSSPCNSSSSRKVSTSQQQVVPILPPSEQIYENFTQQQQLQHQQQLLAKQLHHQNSSVSSTSAAAAATLSSSVQQQQQQGQTVAGQQQQHQGQQNMLSVSGKKKCSNCGDELGRGCAAMVIESLSLYYHINCFRCSVCHIQLGNGTCGTDVRVRSHKLHCNNCYSNDEGRDKSSASVHPRQLPSTHLN